MVRNNYEHFALANEDTSKYSFDEPIDEFGINVLSMFDSNETNKVSLPYIELD